jgi:hypothetical protein
LVFGGVFVAHLLSFLILFSFSAIVQWHRKWSNSNLILVYQVESVVWTSIATGRESDELWCGYFMQQTRHEAMCCTNTPCSMYVISLSSISIKETNKQITG